MQFYSPEEIKRNCEKIVTMEIVLLIQVKRQINQPYSFLNIYDQNLTYVFVIPRFQL